MEANYFFTGFPGFIATQLIKEIISTRKEELHFYLLVLPNMKKKAENEVTMISQEVAVSPNRFTIIVGDITEEGLAIEPSENKLLTEKLTHVFHLAAIYDLAVPNDIAQRVNIKGTDHVNFWVKQLRNLKRYVYFSTAYVSGDRKGRIYETELACGQEFKNFYESTKYEAEVLVDALKPELPVTIIRPGVVVGHSNTGETIKFDGPYFMLNFIDRLKWSPLFPLLGEGAAEVNFVPIDYITRATIYLSHADVGIGKTYHLTDPKPYKAREVYEMMLDFHLNRRPRGRVPLSLAKSFLSIASIRMWLGVEKEALDYFECESMYDSSVAQKDLEGSGVECPDFKDVLMTMVGYYQKHKKDPAKQISIS